MCLGYFMDAARAQPLFLFRLDLEMDLEAFFDLHANSPVDALGNHAVFAVPVSYHYTESFFEHWRVKDALLSYPSRYSRFYSDTL